MTKNADDRFVSIALDPSAYKALRMQANTTGMQFWDYARSLLLEKMSERANEIKENKDPSSYAAKLFLINQRNKDQYNSESIVQDTVIRYNRSHGQDEQALEDLEYLCDQHGLDLEDVLNNAENVTKEFDKLSKSAQKSIPIRQAIIWLGENMKAGEEYSAKDIREQAKEQGISVYALKQAKDELDIMSEKRGMSWVWKIEDEKNNI